MKKRLLAWLLAISLIIPSLSLSAGAAGNLRFSDVSDQNTAMAVESLRLMGVLDGYGDGTFRPSSQLTRAQFCKMATYAMNGQNELGLYKSVTIFPDVKPSHWAAGYINLAAKGKAVIAGYPDGRFYPERTVTVGQAVTILLRLLGYKDEHIGGVWPDSYMAVGAIAGLTEGLSADGNAPLTRAQAAKLFVNLLQAKTQAGGTLYTLSEETELLSVDGGSGTMKTLDGKTYSMVHPVSSSSLTGLRGRVVLSGDKALTFLPSSAQSSGNAAAAIIVAEDHSTVGFDALAGNNTYQIYKNGSPATKNDLRKNDVAIYYAATNSILVCDTRVSAFYESCYPDPGAPTKITVLNGTELYVLPTAQETLSAFKPGQQMVLLLTADGQVAAAVQPQGSAARSNAIGVVEPDGTVYLLCGNSTIQLASPAEEAFAGKVVRITADRKGTLNLKEESSKIRGALNVSERTLDNKPLAENALIFDSGRLISLGELNTSLVRKEQVKYARTNWAGKIDLVVLDRGTDEVYGRVFWEITEIPVYNEDGTPGEPEYEKKVGIEYGNSSSNRAGPFKMNYNVRTGDYAAVKINRGQNGFSQFIKLTQLSNVPKSAWIGRSAVTFGGRTYEVAESILCYNLDSKEWVTLDEAMAYSSTANLYAKDGVIRVIEVEHQIP